MERGRTFEGIPLPHAPAKIMAGVLAVACYFAATHYTPNSSPNEEGGATIEVIQTPESIRYLKTLPLVSNAELPDFIKEQRKKFGVFVDQLEAIDGTDLSEDNDVSWISELSLDEGWHINLKPNEELLRKYIYKKNPNIRLSIDASNMLDSMIDSDGFFTGLGEGSSFSSARQKHRWNVIPQFEENPELDKEDFGDDSDDGPVADSPNVVRFNLLAERKHYDESLFSETPDGKRKPVLTSSTEVIAQADVHFRIPWYRGSEFSDGIITRSDDDAIASEYPLNDEDYQRLHKKAMYYRSYMTKRKPIVIVPRVKHFSGGATSDQFSDLIRLPEKEMEGTSIDHEFAHALLFEARDMESYDQKITGDLDDLFRSISEGVNPDYQSGAWDDPKLDTCKPDYARIFEIFDETTYEDIDCGSGHPADNVDELFASAFTVMKYHHEELIENISSLSGKNKHQAEGLVNQIIAITDLLAEKAGQDPIFSPDSLLRQYKTHEMAAA